MRSKSINWQNFNYDGVIENEYESEDEDDDEDDEESELLNVHYDNKRNINFKANMEKKRKQIE